ncbi:cation transporter [Flammeovirga kamogawensis]|uniref:Cation transporter n=1 Tax=Flammeovirga kamogawensis TaxID=373891 RepID=A0ABX8GY41_9BACT|nr:cation transporter [Flammeovirga kamogawensis]MBB6463924.1 putative Co/Zn/Cd cation transporter (cation efflux family) [Flammeovirga kamogawensis]QWG08313.1 cation transporter [Flammeovirga kamogawensis]TRX66609.1 cation transporter [Flammeovirga kamogawensis]
MVNEDIIERKALKFGIVANLLMAIAGWVTYYFSNSDAMLLDGNFSLISALATIAAIIIGKKKHKRTTIFPFGRYVFESFFVFFKGVLIFGITIVAVVQSCIKIINFFNGEAITPIVIHSILYYTVVIAIISFGIAFYYKHQNKKINLNSPILGVEAKSSIIDGFLTVGIGISLLLVSIIPENSALSFLKYIGDSIIVLIMGIVLINTPIKIIKDAFIELGGGVLQDQISLDIIDQVIIDHLPSMFETHQNYISKLGSNYFIVLYVSTSEKNINVEELLSTRNKISTALSKQFPTHNLEVIIND